jgi:gas vesicle protein
MFSNARTAMKFLVYGLIIGLIFAPRSGSETRKEIMHWASEAVQDTMKNVTGGGSNQASGDTQPINEA